MGRPSAKLHPAAWTKAVHQVCFMPLLRNKRSLQDCAPHLRLLADSAVVIQFEPERYAFRQYAQANRFYLILEGKVELEMESAGREGMIPIRTLGSGDDLGWDWLFPPFYFHASAKAVEPTKTILFFGTHLRQQCEEDHDFDMKL